DISVRWRQWRYRVTIQLCNRWVRILTSQIITSSHLAGSVDDFYPIRCIIPKAAGIRIKNHQTHCRVGNSESLGCAHPRTQNPFFSGRNVQHGAGMCGSSGSIDTYILSKDRYDAADQDEKTQNSHDIEIELYQTGGKTMSVIKAAMNFPSLRRLQTSMRKIP